MPRLTTPLLLSSGTAGMCVPLPTRSSSYHVMALSAVFISCHPCHHWSRMSLHPPAARLLPSRHIVLTMHSVAGGSGEDRLHLRREYAPGRHQTLLAGHARVAARVCPLAVPARRQRGRHPGGASNTPTTPEQRVAPAKGRLENARAFSPRWGAWKMLEG